MIDVAEIANRIVEFGDRVHRAAATDVVPFRWGTAFLNRDLARVWDINLLRVESPSPDIDMWGLIAEADRVLSDVSHRQIWIDDEALALRLAPAFERAGWRTDRHVVMAQLRAPDREPDVAAVRRVSEDLAWPSREEWLRSYEPLNDPPTIDHMRGHYRLINQICDGQDFAVVEDGRVVSFALLHRLGTTGEVADVATLDPYRNRGYAKAVVWRAVLESRRAGCDVTFLVADAFDWPKELYTRMGFDPVSYRHYFLLPDVNARRAPT